MTAHLARVGSNIQVEDVVAAAAATVEVCQELCDRDPAQGVVRGIDRMDAGDGVVDIGKSTPRQGGLLKRRVMVVDDNIDAAEMLGAVGRR